MLRDFPSLIYMRGHRRTFASVSTPGAWLLLMAPGIALICGALAMFIWPALLAYIVGSLLLFGGVLLTGAAWQLRRSERQVSRGGLSVDP
ncbi:MAG: hypothetical protein FJZ47_06995 [Candidatus Tectomicrobia bacterium]|uniref:Uncharacterized protein n=1 Tax=Tectimicrobiota bacterium TaxID=2528274 RepID=A0A938B392_UNCTE|nr:hypothetical protein [Candidatus Tectomicrobia bacterium]